MYVHDSKPMNKPHTRIFLFTVFQLFFFLSKILEKDHNNNYNNGLNITVIVIDINIHNNSIGIFCWGIFNIYQRDCSYAKKFTNLKNQLIFWEMGFFFYNYIFYHVTRTLQFIFMFVAIKTQKKKLLSHDTLVMVVTFFSRFTRW